MNDREIDLFKTTPPFIMELSRRCAREGGRALLVGGCVRSALLGEKTPDFDVEVFGLSADRLERVLSELGPFKRVGKSFGIYKVPGEKTDVGLPRKERKTGFGHKGFEVDIDPFMSVEQAASRRDFTVNALYYDPLRECMEDPLGGISDLQNRLLRHCSPRFGEDPLRVLRAMQFAARLEAEVDPRTLALCRQLSPEGLSGERFYAEWEKLMLEGRRPSKGLHFLQASGWLACFPELEALENCPQEPEWHPEGSVWEHTLHCLDAFARARMGDRLEDTIVGFAVLCHDLGKPATTRFIDGKICAHGHEHAGLQPADHFLSRLKVRRGVIDAILPLVKCHMRPAMLYRDQSSPAAIRRLANECPRLDRLLRVFAADAAGRPPLPDNSAPAIDWLRHRARELDVERKRPIPLIRGKDLLAEGIPQGPHLGSLLRDAYEAQLEGAFETRKEALQWIPTLLRGKR